jgi:2Fe-2S ferredoxin
LPKITFIEPDGTARVLDLPTGDSLMRGALNNDVVGILAECGGAAACATCKIIVAPGWRDRLPKPDISEASMLDADDGEGRRLSCQVEVTDALDGLIVQIPSSQH